ALWRHPDDRLPWLILLTFVVATAAIMLAQIRGARLAVMPIVPLAAWLVVGARHAYLRHPRLVPALGLVLSWLAFAGFPLSFAVDKTIELMPAGRAQEVTAARASKLPCLASS